MKKLPWIIVGDTDCLARGGPYRNLDTLSKEIVVQSQGDLQTELSKDGSDGNPPWILPIVSRLVGSQSIYRPEYLRWKPDDWLPDWRLKFFQDPSGKSDRIVLAPGVVSLQWPVVGGASLGVNPSLMVRNTHTIPYGDALLQAADTLMVKPHGRKLVQDELDKGTPIDQVSVRPLLEKLDGELAKGKSKALPDSFRSKFKEGIKTVDMSFGVDPETEGFHLELGWIEEDKAAASYFDPVSVLVQELRETQGFGIPDLILTRKYPCGGIDG